MKNFIAGMLMLLGSLILAIGYAALMSIPITLL